MFFRLLTSISKFTIFIFIIAIVWNNSTAFCVCITSAATSFTDFGVFVYVIGFLDPSIDDPIPCTNLFPSSISNENPFVDHDLLTNTCNFDGLNFAKESFISILFVCNLVTCRPSYVYYCCHCKCCWNGENVVDFQWFPSNFHIHPHQNDVFHIMFLTSYLCSFNCLSCGYLICGTSCLCSFSYPSCGDVIYGTSAIYLTAYPLLAL